MEDAINNKRPRDLSVDSLEAKRLRPDFLLDILDDADSGDRIPAVQELATVMKSFEEEITFPSSPSDEAESELEQGDSLRSDLGYLFEASDDELGLPPAVPSSSDDGGEGLVTEGEVTGGEPEASGFEQVWWFDDDVASFDFGLGFGMERDVGGMQNVLLLDDGLFGPSDFSDLSWWQESLPPI